MYHLLYDVRTISFYIDSTERSCRAEVLALAAAYTAFVVNSRHEDCSFVSRSVFHHLNSVCRTMFGARAAMVAVDHRDAVLLDPHGVTDMNEGLVLLSYCLNSTRRADLRAMSAFRSAIAAFERHLGLHKPKRVG